MTNDGQKTYAYDAVGRMTSVNGGALGTYGYNGDGKRVKKVEGGATTYYVNSSVLGSAAFELNGTGTVNRVHVTAGGKEIAQLATDNTFYWLHTDHLGTPRRMTNSTGTVMFRGEYDPHGNPLLEWSAIGNPNLNNNKFTGYERDAAAGLDFAQARHYSYKRGRFTQPDPAGLRGARLNIPETLNRYSYINNDPVNGTDPTGMFLPYIPPYYDQGKSACESHGGRFQIVGFGGFGVPVWGCVGAGGSQSPGQGGGGPQGGPSGGSQLRRPSDARTNPTYSAALGELEKFKLDNQKCKDLFKGKNPADEIKKLASEGRIKIGEAWEQYNALATSGPKNVLYPFAGTGIDANAQYILKDIGFRLPNPADYLMIITLNINGRFFNGQHDVSPGGPFSDLTQAEAGALILAHELRHTQDDSFDDSGGRGEADVSMIRKECF